MSEKSRQPFDVLIAGASYAGLALARALLATLGPEITIALVDRGSDPLLRSGLAGGGDPRAFALGAGSQRMLEVIGVWQRVASIAQPVSRIEITDSALDSGVRPVLMTYDNDVGGGEPGSWIVPGAALLAALGAAVAADGATCVIAGSEAVSIDGSGPLARVTLGDGRMLSARLVVAAEGRRSRLRESAGIRIVGWSYGQTGIVATVRHERPHEGVAVQHFLPAGPFAILPLTGNRSCITWSEEAAEAKRILALDDAGFLAEIDKRFGGRLGALMLEGGRGSWPLEMHLARAYVGPRLALVGDTAHGVHPIAGQGLNLALRDVAALTEVLAEAARVGLDIGDGEALRRYERWRRFDAAVSAAAFDGLNRLFSNDWTLVRAARDFGLGVVDRLPALKQMLVTEAAGLSGELPRLIRGERV
ncbi:MAG: FAD-dependent monooxygenase [Pseudomonadota bacterium]